LIFVCAFDKLPGIVLWDNKSGMLHKFYFYYKRECFMKHVNRFWQVVLVLLIALIVLACNGQALMALPTPKSNTSIVPTITAVPTIIAAPINTAVSGPKITLIHLAIKLPPTPTPMPMGTPVSIGDYQVNVMYMRTLNSVYLDRLYAWFPKDGDMYVELGVKVTN
jgi:hypothetical protein